MPTNGHEDDYIFLRLVTHKPTTVLIPEYNLIRMVIISIDSFNNPIWVPCLFYRRFNRLALDLRDHFVKLGLHIHRFSINSERGRD